MRLVPACRGLAVETSDLFNILLEDRNNLLLERQPKHRDLAFTYVDIEFTPNAEFSGQIDAWFNREACSWQHTSFVARL